MISKEAPSPMTPTFNKGLVETVFSDRSIAVERVCTDEGLFESKADWERLFAQSSAQNPFLSWEWMAAWWRHLGAGKLHLLFVRRQGALIGIAPFYQREIRLGGISFRALSFLGDEAVGSDHLDFLSRKGCEDEVAEVVVQAWLRDRRGWDFIALRHMAEESPHADRFLRLTERGWRVQRREGEVCPYLPLAPTWEAFLNRLSASMRYTVRRKIRNLEKGHRVEFIAIDDLHEGRPAMERLLALHQKRWGDRGGSDAFVSEIKLPFHRETAEAFFQQGTARLFFLKADGETVAALYGFILGQRFFYYQAGFDPAWKGKSVGMVLMAKCIEAAISQGWSEFDFLRGPEEYKSHWTSDRRQTQHWILSPPGMKNDLYRFLAASLQTGRRLARRYLPDAWVERLKGNRVTGIEPGIEKGIEKDAKEKESE
ncbi:MAG: GNAT family N-acetyltransferase [Candidatus Manganitrophus sp.]|nr:MAG: GNAT family N-acetyltransferase [Candidatus Manganitrophus sp.]